MTLPAAKKLGEEVGIDLGQGLDGILESASAPLRKGDARPKAPTGSAKPLKPAVEPEPAS